MEDVGEPPLAVPVSTALVLPVVPVVVVVVVVVVVLLLPPPHAAIAVTSDNASSRPAMLQPNCLRCEPANIIVKSIARPSETVLASTHPSGVPGRFAGLVMLAEVVFTVTTTGIPVVAEVEEVNTTEVGLKVQVAAVGRFEHAKLTVPVYPFTG
jgi:hypothetical protein